MEQEQQLQADRALIKEYRQQWQTNKGVSHAVFRWVVDVVQAQSRLSHNMPGHEPAIVSCCITVLKWLMSLLRIIGKYDRITHIFKCIPCRHVCDVFWWLEHVLGINMLDYEEKVVVWCLFLAVLVLIALGAYKQSTQLVQLLKQFALARLK